jgi:hypothetical protein
LARKRSSCLTPTAALNRKVELSKIAATLALYLTKLPVQLAAARWGHQGKEFVFLLRNRWRWRLCRPHKQVDPGAHGFESRSGFVRFNLVDILQQRYRHCRRANHGVMHAAAKRRPNGLQNPGSMRADIDQREIEPWTDLPGLTKWRAESNLHFVASAAAHT